MTSKPILIYRWIVFLLAAGYTIRMIFFSEYDGFSGPFRFLTIWALIASFFAASRMMALVEGRSERRWDGFVSMTAVLNAMVVFLYWRLFLDDPASVTRDGELGALYLELYLHALGPLLQWIDALFIHRAFRKVPAAVAWLIGVIVLYLSWGELVVQRFSDTPKGTVTSGIPYPFLNDMQLPERLAFYGANVVVALVILAGFVGVAWIIRRTVPAPKAP